MKCSEILRQAAERIDSGDFLYIWSAIDSRVAHSMFNDLLLGDQANWIFDATAGTPQGREQRVMALLMAAEIAEDLGS